MVLRRWESERQKFAESTKLIKLNKLKGSIYHPPYEKEKKVDVSGVSPLSASEGKYGCYNSYQRF